MRLNVGKKIQQKKESETVTLSEAFAIKYDLHEAINWCFVSEDLIRLGKELKTLEALCLKVPVM